MSRVEAPLRRSIPVAMLACNRLHGGCRLRKVTPSFSDPGSKMLELAETGCRVAMAFAGGSPGRQLHQRHSQLEVRSPPCTLSFYVVVVWTPGCE
jgi:hypothetical protein